MTEAPTKPPAEKTAQEMFTILCKLLNSPKCANGEAQKRIAAHLRASTGGKYSILVTYHSSSATTDEQKREMYETCCGAIVRNDYSKLLGDIARGDTRVDPAPSENVVVVDHNQQAPQAPPLPPSPRLAPLPDEPAVDESEVSAMLVRALSMLKGSRVDEAKVKQIAEGVMGVELAKALSDIDDKVKHAMNNGSFPEDRVKQIAEEIMAAKGIVQIATVSPKGEVFKMEGLIHRQVTQLHLWSVIANVPTWGWGAAGAGKTHMAKQIAQIGLDGEPLPLTIIPVDPTMTVGKLVGFRNLATGEFVPGLIYRVFKEGGLAVLDEVACGDPGILAAVNTIVSNDAYTFPNGEAVPKHPRFRILVLDNTKGAGAVAGYRARNALDAATLDRFAIMEVLYDEALEWALATGELRPQNHWQPSKPATEETIKQYVEWVHKVRKQAGTSVLISPRAVYSGVKALRCGVPMAEVVEACVFKLTAADTKTRLLRECGDITEG